MKGRSTTIWLTGEDWAALKAAADGRGQSLSGLIAHIVSSWPNYETAKWAQIELAEGRHEAVLADCMADLRPSAQCRRALWTT